MKLISHIQSWIFGRVFINFMSVFRTVKQIFVYYYVVTFNCSEKHSVKVYVVAIYYRIGN